MNAELEREAYDWRGSLDRALTTNPRSAQVAIASEGGLLDCADDPGAVTQLRSIEASCRG